MDARAMTMPWRSMSVLPALVLAVVLAPFASLPAAAAAPAAAPVAPVAPRAAIPTADQSAAAPASEVAPQVVAADKLLAGEGQRWREQTYGLSLRPPLDSQLRTFTGDDAALRIVGENRYLISLHFKKRITDPRAQRPVPTVVVEPFVPGRAPKVNLEIVRNDDKPLDIGSIQTLAITQMAAAVPHLKVREVKKITSADRPGTIIYFEMPDQKPWILGQGFVLLNDDTVAMLQLAVGADQFDALWPVYEAVLQSARLEDLKKLDEEREKLIKRGEDWHQAITPARLRQGLIDEQWFRILDGGRDIGAMRIKQNVGQEMNLAGIEVEVQARIQMGDNAVDTVSKFFLSDDGTQEIWSIETGIHPMVPAARPAGRSAPPDTAGWRETGVRTGNEITVRRQASTDMDKREHRWVRPGRGYLSQVELYTMYPLLPRTAKAELGFYAYYPNAGKIGLRTERIEPAADGSCTIYSRPSADQPEQVTKLDSAGRLAERQIGEGKKIVPANKNAIAAIWGIK